MLHGSALIRIVDSGKLDSRDLLEREYLFIDVVSTFLRAIRAGAIRVQYGAVVLARYGRLEVAFDICSKIIVDVLQEESIVKEKPELVASVIITQAVQVVSFSPIPEFRLLTNIDLGAHPCIRWHGAQRGQCRATRQTRQTPVGLPRHGSQLSVLCRLSSTYIVQIQATLLSWITKKIAGYEKSKVSRRRLHSSFLFRC